ncbi:MAG: HAD family phosphatase [Spirochaetales bacterium]|nr:HAD family phosphatase [Spirochaetales bacterium]
MNRFKLIGFDLDGTLLDPARILRRRTIEALALASDNGCRIAITSGRNFLAVPETIRNLSFIRYFILCNGALIYDRTMNRYLFDCSIPLGTALSVYRDLSVEDVYYDCYLPDGAWAQASHLEKVDGMVSDQSHLKVLYDTREPKEDLIAALKERGKDVCKVQAIFRDTSTRDRVMEAMKQKYPDLEITTAYTYNLEFNMPDATKGKGLLKLAEILGIERKDVAAFGDGGNDISMIEEAGTGFAMANAPIEVKTHADIIAPSNSEDGVAQILEKLYS